MKKLSLLKTVLLLCALIVGSSSVWADDVYLKVTSASDLVADGEYILAETSTETNYLANNYYSSNKFGVIDEGFSISGNLITVTSGTEALVLKLGGSTGEWTLYDVKNTKYIGKSTSSSGGTNFVTGNSASESNFKWTIKTLNDIYTIYSNYTNGSDVDYTNRFWARSGDAIRPYTTSTPGYKQLVMYRKVSSHYVTFSVNGATTSPESIYEGADVNFPVVPETLGGKMFVGWTTSTIDVTDVAPSPLYTTTKTTMGNADITYYAVYANGVRTTGWRKYAASLISEEGVYALLTADYHAFNGTISSGKGQITTNAFEFTDNIATSAPEGTCEITLVAVTGGCKMYNSTYGYLYAIAASSGNLAWHAEEESFWSYPSDNWVYNSNSANLRSYNNSYFNTYSNNSGNEIVFAKKIDIYNYSAYCTSITQSITVTTVGWATFCSEYPLDFTGTGIKAYTGIDGETKVTLNEIAQVPANTPVVLYKADADGTPVNVPVIASADPVADNDLAVVTDEAGKVGVANMFVLSKPAGKKVGFYPWKVGSTLNKGKVYLQGKVYGSREFLGFDDETTGINAIENGNIEANDAVIYNLNGQRVMNPTKGLYIVNGKKVMFNK